MLYLNTETGAFGLTIDQVRAALPHVGLNPDNLPEDCGFTAYTESAASVPAWNQTVVEAAPVNGVQQWAVTTLTGDALDAATDALHASKLAAVQAAKASALATMPATVQGTTYQITISTTDQVDLQMQIQALQQQPSGATCVWEIVDGVFLTLGLADLEGMLGAGIVYVQAVYANAASLTAQVNAAANGEVLSNIDIAQGWPT